MLNLIIEFLKKIIHWFKDFFYKEPTLMETIAQEMEDLTIEDDGIDLRLKTKINYQPYSIPSTELSQHVKDTLECLLIVDEKSRLAMEGKLKEKRLTRVVTTGGTHIRKIKFHEPSKLTDDFVTDKKMVDEDGKIIIHANSWI